MNVTLMLLSSACVAGQAPIVVSGSGCNGCGSAPAATFASASFGATACGSCGTPAAAGRAGLFDRLRGLFRRDRGCGGDCGNAPVIAAAPCDGPCGSPIRSSFVASYTATAAPNCCGPVLRSSFPVGFNGCCDAGPAPRAGLFSRLRARTSGSGNCGCTGAVAGTVVAAPVVPGCTPTVGTVGTPVVGNPVGNPGAQPPVVMPKPMDPVKEPAKDPVKEPAKEPKKEGTALPPGLPAVPADLPRIPTLNGLGGGN